MKPVVLIDTNVVIDLLAKREPFWQSAAQLFALAEQNQIEAYVNSLTLVTVYYILRAHHRIPHRQIIDAFGLLTSYIGIADVTAAHLQGAMTSDFDDFEDAVVYHSAAQLAAGITIITRNTADFSSASAPVLTPDAWLSKHYTQ